MSLTDELLEEFGGKRSVRGNLDIEQSLVELYDKTWGSLTPNDVFVEVEVERERDRSRAKEITPKTLTALMWKVDGKTPVLLKNKFNCEGILIRDEYEFMLKTIWDVLAGGNGHLFGYTKSVYPTNLLPPYNPFSTFALKEADDQKIPGIVITGTPGIGKSMFLFVVLALRLIARKATVLQYSKDLFLIFHSNGVHSTKVFEEKLANSLPLDTWFLFDSNENIRSPPEDFYVASRTNARLMLVTASPRRERIHFSKELRIKKLWMMPFTLSELIMARQIQFVETKQSEKMLQSFYDKYGPMAREAFRFAHVPAEYEEEIKSELQDTSLYDIQEGMRLSSAGFSFNRGLTYKILHAIPLPNAREFVVSIPTQRLANLVMENLLDRSEQVARSIIFLFLLHSNARGVAGSLLDSLALMKLPRGGQWAMTLLTQVQNRSIHPKNVRWKTHHDDKAYSLRLGYRNAFLEILHGNRRAPAATNISPVPTSYFDSGSNPAMKNGFHIPKAKNQAAFDAYAYDAKSKHAVLFLVTCSNKYDLKDEAFQQLGITSADVVLITSYDGGADLHAELKVATKVKNVYRLVLIPDYSNA